MLLHICFCRAYDLVSVFFFLSLFLDRYGAPERHGVALGMLDDPSMRKLLLDRAYSILTRGLEIPRLFVLGIFGKIAQRARVLELLGDLATPHSFQVLELRRQFVEFFFAQIVRVVILHSRGALYLLGLREQAEQYVERST